MIERILREEGVPQDLIYLAQAESDFNPYAVSRVGARESGSSWESRARGYDLHHDIFVDERQTLRSHPRAAPTFEGFYSHSGLVPGNGCLQSGPGTIQSAVKRTG